MEHRLDALRMSFCTEQGVKIEIYDACCAGFTRRDKERADFKISELLSRAELRRHLSQQDSESAQRDGDRKI